ncbi:hypothetical protein ES703_22268 [subsurface metagenome]
MMHASKETALPLRGHSVLSSVHATDAIGAPFCLMYYLGVEPLGSKVLLTCM